MSRAVTVLVFGLVAFLGAAFGFVAAGGGRVASPPASTWFGGSPPTFAEVVARVNPAVVHVDVIDETRRDPHEGIEDAPALDLPNRGEGSGFIVDPEGYILTNHHLVPGPGRIRVRLADKRELKASLVGSDASTDLALLKVEARGLPTVPLGDSDRLRVGDWVCAIGNPLEFDHTVTVGVVSSKGRKIFNASFDSYIQTDAAINFGNSGGPLVNVLGEAVGINAAVSSEAQGIGFAVPINLARSVLGELRRHGRVQRGYLGVELHELDPDLARMIGLGEAKGALVLDVVKGEPGETAGLRRWDVITSVSSENIDDGDDLVRTISSVRPGTEVQLGVVRDGRPLALAARLGERGEEQPEPDPVQPVRRREKGDALGLSVANLGARSRAEMAVPSDRVGAEVRDVLGADPGTDAIERGDLIIEVNRKATPDAAEYRRIIDSLRPGESAWLLIYRPRPPGTFLTRVEVDRRR